MIKNICEFLNNGREQINIILIYLILSLFILSISPFSSVFYCILALLSPILSLIPFCFTNPQLTYLITRYYNYVKYFINKMSNAFLNLLPNVYKFLDQMFMKEYFKMKI